MNLHAVDEAADDSYIFITQVIIYQSEYLRLKKIEEAYLGGKSVSAEDVPPMRPGPTPADRIRGEAGTIPEDSIVEQEGFGFEENETITTSGLGGSLITTLQNSLFELVKTAGAAVANRAVSATIDKLRGRGNVRPDDDAEVSEMAHEKAMDDRDLRITPQKYIDPQDDPQAGKILLHILSVTLCIALHV